MPTLGPSTLSSLGWAQMTSFVNLVKQPAGFLTSLFMPQEETLFTETAELSYREGERFLAPFVEVNGEAIAVGGRSTVFANVQTPNIRIKRPMDAFNAFLRRAPGTQIFQNSGDVIRQAREQALADDMAYMVELVQNRKEWMVAQALVNDNQNLTITYNSGDRANFTVAYPRQSAMRVTLTGGALWTAPSTANPVADFLNMKRLFARWLSTPCAGAIMDSYAADLFLAIPGVKDLLDKRNISAGTLNLQAQFEASGAILHGTFCGVPIWEYGREYVDEDGTTKWFMGGTTAASNPPGRILFFAGGNAMSENKMLYGAIPDHDAFEQGLFVGKQFSKATKTFDPSVYTQLLHTRPLPLFRKPNAFGLLKVA